MEANPVSMTKYMNNLKLGGLGPSAKSERAKLPMAAHDCFCSKAPAPAPAPASVPPVESLVLTSRHIITTIPILDLESCTTRNLNHQTFCRTIWIASRKADRSQNPLRRHISPLPYLATLGFGTSESALASPIAHWRDPLGLTLSTSGAQRTRTCSHLTACIAISRPRLKRHIPGTRLRLSTTPLNHRRRRTTARPHDCSRLVRS